MGDTSTNINPWAFLLLVTMAFQMLRGQRQSAAIGLLAIAVFLPLGQQIVLFGLHFLFFRILIIVGFVRVLSRGETRGFELSKLDKWFICWALTNLVFSTIRNPAGFMGEKCLGAAFNCFGLYFLFRFLVKDANGVVIQLRFLIFAALIISGAMAYEVMTHRDLFHVFGGVPELILEREGRFRCQGPFQHPILAGTFFATLLPLLIGLWLQGGRDRKFALLGLVACGFSILATASSGPLLTCVTAMIGFGLWPLRYRMHLFRRGALAVILGLTVLMDAPVWYLISRVSNITGGTGWYRSFLIDQAIKHFGEWWLIGTSYTAQWAPGGEIIPSDPNNMDITNQYIFEGIHGGVLGLCFFLAMIVACFKIIGRAVRTQDTSVGDLSLLWAIGVSLACHCTAFISISYFDQIEVFWFWLLAVIAAVPMWTSQQSGENTIPEGVAEIGGIPPAGAGGTEEDCRKDRQQRQNYSHELSAIMSDYRPFMRSVCMRPFQVYP